MKFKFETEYTISKYIDPLHPKYVKIVEIVWTEMESSKESYIMAWAYDANSEWTNDKLAFFDMHELKKFAEMTNTILIKG